MKTRYFIFAVAALALGACAKQEQAVDQPAEAPAQIAVGFDAYTTRGVDTKAGVAGELTTTRLKNNTTPDAMNTAGFGVFAFYTDNNDYDSNSLPNFMYNEQVTWDGSDWTYAPVKYWPNEYGSTAISDDTDKVSFFAYAPWVKVVPSSGKYDGEVEETKWGITGLSRNTSASDPLVKYMVSFDPHYSVDLVWGVVPAATDPAAKYKWDIINSDIDQEFDPGKPWKNVQRPEKTNKALKFDFKHATSKLNVQIDADPDITSHDKTTPLATDTKVYVRSITFEGFAIKGALNLNNQNDAAYWMDFGGVDDLMTGDEVTIFDGRKDGKEGAADATASNEKVLGLNPVIISDNGNTTAGVTAKLVNLFGKTNEDGTSAEIGEKEPVYVIPTGDAVKVTIVYDVETEDENLAVYLSDGKTFGSSVENKITKSITFDDSNPAKFESGKAYTIKLHLGLNSVKFAAKVTGWDEPTDTVNPWLPQN